MNEEREAADSARVIKFNPRFAMFASGGVDAVSRNQFVISEPGPHTKFPHRLFGYR